MTNDRGDRGAVQLITTIAVRLREHFKILFFFLRQKYYGIPHVTSQDRRHPVVHPERVIVTIVVHDHNNNNNN